MFNIVRKEMEWGGAPLVIETGKVARQADGAVIVSYGETSVLCTAVAQKQPKPDIDFFPLTVSYIEKTYAVNKIPGGFFKREGRPSEREILTSRLIDRPIRPLFADGFNNETQIVCTVLAYDQKHAPEIAAMIGTSAALAISGIPFNGPVVGARVGYINSEYVLNPTNEALLESDLDLMVAGTESSVLMVESEAKELSEVTMLGAVNFGHEQMQPVIQLIKDLQSDAGKPAWEHEYIQNTALYGKVQELAQASFADAYKIQSKQDRSNALADARSKVEEQLIITNDEGNAEWTEADVRSAVKKLEKNIVRSSILQNSIRIDGRGKSDVRNIVCEVDVLPGAHGSALFTRGETQSLVVTTLGSKEDAQIIDDLEGNRRESFMLHYNFPPYSVGEATMLRPPGRREIGHGKLAWRATCSQLPLKEDFPYTIRVVSEITESNGSSSMATVCGTSLALMDAGVPFKKPVAGIAMGLIKEENDYAVLSDIMGDEDHLGDMDFKVAGTESGITALQMDIKIEGINSEIMENALSQALEGRLHILDKMKEAIATPREVVKDTAPSITTIRIPKDKIREVIGAGGKVIKEICEVSGAKIDIEEEKNHGLVSVVAVGKESRESALSMINNIIAEPEVGVVYDGKVARVAEFGAFVTFLGSTDGLVHISELANQRVNKVEDICTVGDTVKVLVLNVDKRNNRIKLSMRRVNQDTGEVLPDERRDSNKSDDRREPKSSDSKKSDQSDASHQAKHDSHNENASPEKPEEKPKKRKRRFF